MLFPGPPPQFIPNSTGIVVFSGYDFFGGGRFQVPVTPSFDQVSPGFNFPTNPIGEGWKMQAQFSVGTIEQNADGGTHFVELLVNGLAIVTVSAFNATGINVVSPWVDIVQSGTITLRRWTNFSNETAKVLGCAVSYRNARF